MSQPAGMLSGCVLPGAAGRALAGLAAAVQAAERAGHTVAALEASTQPQAVDFGSLDLNGWKRWASLSMFKGKDGIVRFTDGRAPVFRRPDDGGIEISLYVTALGGPMSVRAETLLAESGEAMPAILCFGGRAGELAPTLRVRGLPATLAPHGDVPMTEAVELRVAGSRPCVLPLQQALEALGIAWTPLDGT
eukprot:5932856-Pleurochrysis_carterae.AAC.1